jgi:hypothetical protein
MHAPPSRQSRAASEEVRRLPRFNLELVARIRQTRSELGSDKPRVAEILDTALEAYFKAMPPLE